MPVFGRSKSLKKLLCSKSYLAMSVESTGSFKEAQANKWKRGKTNSQKWSCWVLHYRKPVCAKFQVNLGSPNGGNSKLEQRF